MEQWAIQQNDSGVETLKRKLKFLVQRIRSMQYMIIENFKQDKVKEVYKRYEEKGRLMPDGLHFVNSWVNEDVTVCFQVMEADEIDKLEQWMKAWSDLVEFEVIPVITSQQAKERIFKS